MHNATRAGHRRNRFGWPGMLAVLALASVPLAGAEGGSLPKVSPELEKVRAHLEKYTDPVTAIREGYFSALACVHLAEGGMGVHFINLGLMGPEPDPMAPQVLVYAPEGGKLRLVSAEWFVPLATGIKERPTLFGQGFHGPTEGHYHYQPREVHHYDLHVWLFDDNPDGLFNDTNPNVKCAGKWPFTELAERPKTVPHPQQ